MKRVATIIFSVLATIAAYGGNALWFYPTDGDLAIVANLCDIEKVENHSGTIVITTQEGETYNLDGTKYGQRVEPGPTIDGLTVLYEGATSRVGVPFTETSEIIDGIEVRHEGTKVVVTTGANVPDNYVMRVFGTATEGALKVYNTNKLTIELGNVSLRASNSSALNLQGASKVTLKLIGESTLEDAETYETPEGEKEKGTLHSQRKLEIKGEGVLNIIGRSGHGISANKTLTISGGRVNIVSSVKDGINGDEGFEMNGGEFTTTVQVGSDGIDVNYIAVTGGRIDMTIGTADSKGLKAADYITLSGGDLNFTVSGDCSKAIKAGGLLTIESGAHITATLSGKVVLEALGSGFDPSYCSLIKAQEFVMTGGTIKATHNGEAGKGISVDGNARFEGGEITITVNGNGGVYTDQNGDKDSYSSTCITIDGDLTITGGEFTLRATGSAGKCIKVDGSATFGDENGGPTIDAGTTGGQILVSGTTGGGGGGWPGWGPGGGGQNSDYSNPKVIKVVGNFVINGGDYRLTASEEGGEGLESKSTLTINGGDFRIMTSDDCINASQTIVINGGRIACRATNNDGIDSNGTLTITGGIVVSIGAKSPEEGFDCDNNTFTITGGYVFGIGGATSNPTASTCQQCVAIVNKSLSTNSVLTITDQTSGEAIMSFTYPGGAGSTILFSAPTMSKGQKLNLYTNGTLTGGETFEWLTVGGSFSGGSGASATTLSTTSYVTGSSSGGGPGGGPR